MLLTCSFVQIIVLSSFVFAGESGGGLTAAVRSVTAAELREHVQYLADDRLEGREAGSPGARQAAEWLQSQLMALGLAPAGEASTYFQAFGDGYCNVLACWKGTDPALSGEFVVLCAHYDHIGYGTPRNSRGEVGQIHNGADDNASGTALLLEVAEAFTVAPELPGRSVLFAFWDAEEKGLLGSKHWLNHPTVDKDKIVAAINVDMVGRLRNRELHAVGWRSGAGWRRLLSENNAFELTLHLTWGLRPDSDHIPFFRHGIPTIMFHTGLHEDYHRPSDDVDRLYYEGMEQVSQFTFQVVWTLATQKERLRFRPEADKEKPPEITHPCGDRLGAVWIEDSESSCVRIESIRPEGPAAKAGLEPGDEIVQVGDLENPTSDSLASVIASAKSSVTLEIRRGSERNVIRTTIDLEGEPNMTGFCFRRDDAEPGVLIVTKVLSGSPAALLGLRSDDRIIAIDSRAIAMLTDEETKSAFAAPPSHLLVERQGRCINLAASPTQ